MKRSVLGNHKKVFGKYIINSDKVMRGANWLVYPARTLDGNICYLKEYYPIDSSCLSRNKDGFLIVNSDDDKDEFIKKMNWTINHEIEMQNLAEDDDKLSLSDYYYTNNDSIFHSFKLEKELYDDQSCGDVEFVVMDTASGRSLEEYIVEQRQLEDSIDVLISLAKAIIKLHNRDEKILHLDLKPSNLFVTDSNRIVILDFGSAIKKGSIYTNEEIKYTGISSYTGYYASESLKEVCKEKDVKKKIELISTLDESTDIWSFVRICEDILDAVCENRKTINDLFDLYEKQEKDFNFNLYDFIKILTEVKYTEIQKNPTLLSIKNNSQNMFNKNASIRCYNGNFCSFDIDEICNNIENKIVTYVYSNPGNGKTQLLSELWRRYLKNDEFTPIYVDLDTLPSCTSSDAKELFIKFISDNYGYNIVSDKYKDSILFLIDNCQFDWHDTINDLCVDYKLKNVVITQREYRSYNSPIQTFDSRDKFRIDNWEDDDFFEIVFKFFESKKDYFIYELSKTHRDFHDGLPYNIDSLKDLLLAFDIKLKNPDIHIEDISLIREAIRIRTKYEKDYYRKRTFMEDQNNFLPELAIKLYFDNGEKELKLDYPGFYENLWKLKGEGVLSFYKDNNILKYDFINHVLKNYYIAYYLLSDFINSVDKCNSLFVRFRISNDVLKQFAQIVDNEFLENMSQQRNLVTYRNALKNLGFIYFYRKKLNKNNTFNVKLGSKDNNKLNLDDVYNYKSNKRLEEIYNEYWVQGTEFKKNISIENKCVCTDNSVVVKIVDEEKIICIYENKICDINLKTDEINITEFHKDVDLLDDILPLSDSLFLTKEMEWRSFTQVSLVTGVSPEGEYIRNKKIVRTDDAYDYDYFWKHKLKMKGTMVDAYSEDDFIYLLVKRNNPFGEYENYFDVYRINKEGEGERLFVHHHDDPNIGYNKIRVCKDFIILGQISMKYFDELERTYTRTDKTNLINNVGLTVFTLSFDASSTFEKDDLVKLADFRKKLGLPSGEKWIRSKSMFVPGIVNFDIMYANGDPMVILQLGVGRLGSIYAVKVDILPEENYFLLSKVKALFSGHIESFALMKDISGIVYFNDRGKCRLGSVKGDIVCSYKLPKSTDYTSLQFLSNNKLWCRNLNDKYQITIIDIKNDQVNSYRIC